MKRVLTVLVLVAILAVGFSAVVAAGTVGYSDTANRLNYDKPVIDYKYVTSNRFRASLTSSQDPELPPGGNIWTYPLSGGTRSGNNRTIYSSAGLLNGTYYSITEGNGDWIRFAFSNLHGGDRWISGYVDAD